MNRFHSEMTIHQIPVSVPLHPPYSNVVPLSTIGSQFNSAAFIMTAGNEARLYLTQAFRCCPWSDLRALVSTTVMQIDSTANTRERPEAAIQNLQLVAISRLVYAGRTGPCYSYPSLRVLFVSNNVWRVFSSSQTIIRAGCWASTQAVRMA